MNENDSVQHRLAMLDGIELSQADVEFISSEIKDLERVVVELEKFSGDTPWISQQIQPSGKKA
jgi:hypothetical protein